jgi:hypothetical protein
MKLTTVQLDAREVIIGPPVQLRTVSCEGEPHDQAGDISRRCSCCGSPMPRDIGEWIVGAGAKGEVALFCSAGCDPVQPRRAESPPPRGRLFAEPYR